MKIDKKNLQFYKLDSQADRDCLIWCSHLKFKEATSNEISEDKSLKLQSSTKKQFRHTEFCEESFQSYLRCLTLILRSFNDFHHFLITFIAFFFLVPRARSIRAGTASCRFFFFFFQIFSLTSGKQMFLQIMSLIRKSVLIKSINKLCLKSYEKMERKKH